MLIQRHDYRMDVIWHDAPGYQTVALAIEVEEGILDHRGDVGGSKPTTSQSRVQLPVSLGEIIR